MTTYCDECLHCFKQAQATYKWLCTKHPKEPKPTYLKRDEVTEPYERCNKINNGECELFEKIRTQDV